MEASPLIAPGARALVVVAALLPALAAAEPDRRADEHSYAEPTKVRMQDLALDLTVDFRGKQLVGTATLDLDWVDPAARELVLDTRDLVIAKVEASSDGARWKRVKFALAKRDAAFGQKLTIAAAHAPKVRITYRTTPKASGLQWMPAKLTANGKAPFVFSQSQAIHARSWVPLQDTPSVRFRYTARIQTPKNVVALMSANNNPAVVRDGDYAFAMTEPIPSYLLAIAVGDLEFKPISPRCGVWAEPPVLDRAIAELADTEKMIAATEALYGPYRWGRYDLLLLPASFPFGGMENPRLSFITPTLLVGDKSLVSLIAHELAHSWSGNLVTTASWKDVWLNEGFTTYVENRIVEAVYGREFAEIELVMTQTSLRDKLPSMAKDRQRLRLPATPGQDPEASGDVSYEKGQWFLETLERRFGRAVFDPFLRKWFEAHAFQSVTTDDFVAFLRAELVPKRPNAMTDAEIVEWVEGEGLPQTAVIATSKRLAAVDATRAKWLAGSAKLSTLGTERWSTQERIHFLDQLPHKLSREQIVELDTVMKLTGTQNGEYAERWYPLTIRAGYREARPALAAFVSRVGRRKLIMPIYRALIITPEGRTFAQQTFARAKAGYHPLTIAGVAALLAAKPKKPKP